MSLLNLILKITADGASAEAALKRTQSSVESLGKQVSNAFTAGAVIAFAKSAGAAADATKDMAEQLNVSVDQMLKLKRAADESGIGVEKFQTIFAKLNEARKKAGEGDQETRDNFKAFGVELQAINSYGYETVDIIMALGDGIAKLGKLNPKQEGMLADLIGPKNVAAVSALRELSNNPPGNMFFGSLENRSEVTNNLAEQYKDSERFLKEMMRRGEDVLSTVSWLTKGIGEWMFGLPAGTMRKEANARWKAEEEAARQKQLENVSAGLQMYEDKKKQAEDFATSQAAIKNDVANARNREKQREADIEAEFGYAMDQARPGGKLALLRAKRRAVDQNRYADLQDPDEYNFFKGDADAAADREMRAIDAQMAGIRRGMIGTNRRGPVSSLAATGNMIFGGGTRDPIPILEGIEKNTRQESITRRTTIDHSIAN